MPDGKDDHNWNGEKDYKSKPDHILILVEFSDHFSDEHSLERLVEQRRQDHHGVRAEFLVVG